MFTHLHVHTEYSMLDGLSRIQPLIARAKELKMNSLAITDHGGMYGAIDFYQTAKESGIRPIIGCEMYVAPGSRHEKSPKDRNPYHMTVLAKDAQGYQNLVKLCTKAQLEGFYYKPRVDRELLQQYRSGLIVLSGCPSGEVPTLIAQERMEEAKSTAMWYKELFSEYYLELMEHGGVPQLPAINKGLMDLHRTMNIPIVATNDSHYVSKKDASLQDILICIHTNTNINNPRRLKMEEESYYLKSHDEMQALYTELPQAITNTEQIAEMCDLELDFSQLRMPEYDVPDGMNADEYLSQLSWEGLDRRLESITTKDKERLSYELEVIKQTRYANYFLVVWDIARFVRKQDIFFAVRGSAAASLTLFCLGATDVNPIKYGLIFERFLHAERNEMPDIDMDFQDDRREEVINYVVSKYGRDRVAQIITFGTLGARASIRDVGRALDMPYSQVDNVAKLVPSRLHIALDEALDESPELQEIYTSDKEVNNLVNIARSLEGLTRHSSTHAAGVVISKDPLDDTVPLQKPSKGGEDSVSMTQYAMEPIRALGLQQMDFLGLANLTILAKTRELISNTQEIHLNLRDIPLDDAKTFDVLSKGETVGVFQLEGAGMTRYIKELKPSSLSDVAAMIALYRPGPMEHITTFIDAKHGRVEPKYPHPAFKDVLEETYGVIVYQDQVLLIARAFAGYSLGEADTVRKAMGKKIPEVMAQQRENFIQGALKQGYSDELADQVFALIEPFAGYAFNKAHAVSYGLISYWTAYLKTNYPTEYMVSLLNTYIGNTEKITGAVAECRRIRIPIHPPDINKSQAEFSIEIQDDGSKAIRFGLSAVKNVGTLALNPILETREREGPFSSMEHTCRVADMGSLNRKTMESLIKVGAFDCFADRSALLGVLDRIITLAQSETKLRKSNQTSMFDLFGQSVPTPLANITFPDIKTPESEMHTWEMELLGMALYNQNSLHNLISNGNPETIVFLHQLDTEMDGSKVVLAGQISSAIERLTRDKRPFTIATLSLMDGPIEVFVWEELQKETYDLWKGGKLVTIAGTIRVRNGQISISCADAKEYTVPEMPQSDASDSDVTPRHQIASAINLTDRPHLTTPDHHPNSKSSKDSNTEAYSKPEPEIARRLNLRITETGQTTRDRNVLDGVKRILLDHQGNDEVTLQIITDSHIVTLEWPLVKVKTSTDLEQNLQKILGSDGSVYVEDVQI